MIKSILAVFFAVVLAGCASVDSIPADYAGPDAGKVVISIGAATGTEYSSYSLLFRKQKSTGSAEKQAVGRFTYFQTNMFYKQAPDFHTNGEAGVVLVQALPPGDYAIYNFDVFNNAGTVQSHYFSKVDISIPFTVRPGQTTYLGNYQANHLSGKNMFGMPLPAGAVFIVSDRLASELPIAQARTKTDFGTPVNATPDPKRLENPFFVSRRKSEGYRSVSE
jgi:hypothetical protein